MNRSETIAYLTASAGQRVIIGQYAGAGSFYPTGWNTYIAAVKTETNQTPALVGADLAYGDWTTTWTNKLISHWQAGGLVQLSWHINNPWTGEDVTDLTIGDPADLWTAGNAAYTYFHADMDAKAVILQRLYEAGVPVIWRPFHECNGQWHWYENWAVDDYISLWREMYYYLMSVKGLTNLIWLFAPNRWYDEIARPESYYPGDFYVDLVGLSAYGNLEWITDGGGYEEMLALGKPFVLSEFGPGSGDEEPPVDSYNYGNLPAAIASYCPQTVYFMPWNGNYSITRQLGTTTIMNYSNYISLEDLASTPTPSGTTYTKRRLTGFMSKPQFVDLAVIRGDTNILTTFDFPQVYETISEAALTIREEIDADDVTLQLYATMTSGQFNLGKYTLTVTLNPDDTLLLVPGEYVYDCKLTIEEQIMTVARGKITVIGDVYNAVSSD